MTIAKFFSWFFCIGLMRLNFGGSESSSTSETNNFDQRKVLGEGVQYADNGSAVVSTNTQNTVYSVQDSEATKLGFKSLDNGFAFAGDTVYQALGFGSDALDSSGKTFTSALNFANDAVAGALSSNNRALASTIDFASDSLGRTLSTLDRQATATLTFASDSKSEAFAMAAKAQTLAANQAAAAQSDAFGFAAARAADSAKAQREALDVATASLSDALAYGGKQTGLAIDTLTGSTNLVKDAYADAKGRGALTDKILMLAIGLAGFVAWSAVRKG